MKPEDITKYMKYTKPWHEPRAIPDRSSELERRTLQYFNSLVEHEKEIFFRSNELIYALIKELREEVMSKQIDWDRKKHGQISWGSHRSGIINKDGSLTYFDSVDDKAYKVNFDSEDETPRIDKLGYIGDYIIGIFEVSKKLGIELEGKYFPYLKVK